MKKTKLKLENIDTESEFLTHWTGRGKSEDEAFRILKLIVSSQKLKFGYNTTSSNSSDAKIENLMICFTDIPIYQSYCHCREYKYFGINF